MTNCLSIDLQWRIYANDSSSLNLDGQAQVKNDSSPNSLPTDLIELAKVVGAWGVKGQVSIKPYSQFSVLRDIKTLWLQYRYQDKLADRMVTKTAWAQINVPKKPKEHSDVLLYQLACINTPEQANLLKGCRVFVARSQFPKLEKDEFYWTDLIGLKVKNLALQDVGVVKGVAEYGAHPVLEVLCSGDKKESVELIPFVLRHVPTVDLEQGFLVVDWYFD